MKRGFSTIELMIAMAIMTMVLSAVVVVSFGNQTFLSNTQTSSEAMVKAQSLLEQQQALGRKDFNLVNPVASTTDDIFQKAVNVSLKSDMLTKEVKALVSWTDEHQLAHTLELTTLVSNFDTPVGANTCSSALSGNWQNPVIESTINFASLSGVPAGTYTLSDVDAIHKKLYVTARQTSAITDPTLFVFDISNPASPSLLGKVDNAVGVATGLNAVRAAQDPSTGKVYAYAANAASNNYSTCNPKTNTACGQLSVFDVSNALAPVLSSNLMIASSTSPFVKGSQVKGNAIYYKNGFVFLGLTAAGSGNGPEFHVIDVHNPTSLFTTDHIAYPIGTFAVSNDVNAIAMRSTYAYLVTANSTELQIVNMSNPNAPVSAGTFNSASGSGNGKSIVIVGDSVYVGKTVPNTGNDFHILNGSNPAVTQPELGGADVPSSVNAIIVRDYLSFLLTNTDLRIYRTDTPAAVSVWGTAPQLTLPQSGHATVEPSMDCEDNRLYITSNNAAGQGYLYVVKPGI